MQLLFIGGTAVDAFTYFKLRDAMMGVTAEQPDAMTIALLCRSFCFTHD